MQGFVFRNRYTIRTSIKIESDKCMGVMMQGQDFTYSCIFIHGIHNTGMTVNCQ